MAKFELFEKDANKREPISFKVTTGMVESRSTSLLDCDFNNSQLIYNNACTAGFDHTHNMALKIVKIQRAQKMRHVKFIFCLFNRSQNHDHTKRLMAIDIILKVNYDYVYCQHYIMHKGESHFERCIEDESQYL
jgi:hypothetical protein